MKTKLTVFRVPNTLSSLNLAIAIYIILFSGFVVVFKSAKCATPFKNEVLRHKLPTNQGVKAYLLPQQKSADTKQKADVLSQSRQNIPRPSHINRRHKIPRVDSSTYQYHRFRLPQPPVVRSRSAFSRAVKTFFDKSVSRYTNFQGGITIPTIFGLTQSSTKDEPKDRIFNGWELPPHEFPWMVKLKSYSKPNRYGKGKTTNCGGALLNHRWVITARHCITWSPAFQNNLSVDKGIPAESIDVFLGGHNQFGEDGLRIPADKAIGRQDYGRPLCSRNTPDPLCNLVKLPFLMDTTFTNDIALVRLSQEVDYTQWVSPVKLPQLGQNKKYYGETAYVSGWGIRGPGLGPSFSLKGAALTVVDGAVTRGCNKQSNRGKMCAVNSRDFGVSGSTCPGDSGSPLVTWDDQNDGWTLIGVLSNGARSCFQGMPEVYTEVVSYLRWIQETMERHEREDIQNEDSYLFYPFFEKQQISSPQRTQYIRTPRNILTSFLSLWEK